MNKAYKSSVRSPELVDEPVLWFAFLDAKLLVHEVDGITRPPFVVSLEEIGLSPIRQQYLGTLDGQHCFSAELDPKSEIPDGWELKGLRHLFSRLPEAMFWVAGAAVQIVDWDRNHQYCGRCSTQTVDRSHERAKACPNCGLLSYPRISPAIIVLVQKGEQLLLARAHHFPPDRYSVLAGFVEPGETLEDAVRREVYEEVGLTIRNIRYFGSQPWPFPNSLMIAFTCEYAGGEIVLEQEEMADAGWYSAGALPRIPPRISIARQLIDWFVNNL